MSGKNNFKFKQGARTGRGKSERGAFERDLLTIARQWTRRLLTSGGGTSTAKTVATFGCGLFIGAYTIRVYERSRRPPTPTLADATHHVTFRFGVPEVAPVRSLNENLSVQYDRRNKNPLWVLEHLSKDLRQESFQKKDSVSRKYSEFVEDFSEFDIYRAPLSAFVGSNYDRGHLAPAADFAYSQEAMDSTFNLVNICPQSPALNRGMWLDLERWTRSLTRHFDNVYVASGPLYLADKSGHIVIPQLDKDALTPVSIPNAFFKVICAERRNGDVRIGAFILPNAPIDTQRSLAEFMVEKDTVDRLSGVRFFPLLTEMQRRGEHNVKLLHVSKKEKGGGGAAEEKVEKGE